MNRCTLIVVIMFCAQAVNAQFNDSTHYFISAASSGILNRANNVQSYVFNNALKLNVRRKSLQVNSTNTWIYGWQQKALTNNDFASALDFNLYKTFPNFYYWGLMSYDKSYSLQINKRLQTGLGAAYNLLDSPRSQLNISNGIIYESNDIKVNDSTNDRNRTFRNSFRLRYRFELGIVVVQGTNLLQHSLTSTNDYNIQLANSLNFQLKKWLLFSIATTYNQFRLTNRENLLITFGITAENYF